MRLRPQRRHIRAGGRGLVVCSVTTVFVAFSVFAFPLLLLGRGPSEQGSHQELQSFRISATVIHLKLLLSDGPPAIEIITTAPVSPKISKLDGPMRLVIDLPNTNMSVARKLVPVEGQDVSAIRLELNATNPPLVHVEVDLRKPMDYTWESAGNRLLVSLHAVAAKLAPASAPIDAVDLSNVVPVDRLAVGRFCHCLVRHNRAALAPRRRFFCLPAHHSLGYPFSEWSRHDASDRHRRPGGACHSGQFCGRSDHPGFPHSASWSGEVRLCDPRRFAGQHVCPNSSREHIFGNHLRTHGRRNV